MICRVFGAYSLQCKKRKFSGLRLEYALEGTSNFRAWKDKMEVVLDDNGVWDIHKLIF